MTRKEYLSGLAEDFGVPRSEVFMLASLLGESEDYDGLVSMLEDLADSLDNFDEWKVKGLEIGLT